MFCGISNLFICVLCQHRPEKELDDLLKTCDLILYDMLNDPDERTNLLAGNDPSELEEYKGARCYSMKVQVVFLYHQFDIQ